MRTVVSKTQNLTFGFSSVQRFGRKSRESVHDEENPRPLSEKEGKPRRRPDAVGPRRKKQHRPKETVHEEYRVSDQQARRGSG